MALLILGIERWLNAGMEENRGQLSIDLETRQKIYDTWIENSQALTDNRNDKCKVKISKLDFIKKFYGIENSNIIIEERTNKKGRVSFVANQKIRLCSQVLFEHLRIN